MNKKIAMFVAFQGFRDEEYIEPKKVFEKAGIKVDTVSTAKGQAKGKFTAVVQVDKVISEINPSDYDGLVLIGGPGALAHLDNFSVYSIFKKGHESGKVIAAICISPVILAHAGLLKGKKATVWSDGVQELRKAGANYTGSDVEIDGKIVTAEGPVAAQKFADTVKSMLQGEN